MADVKRFCIRSKGFLAGLCEGMSLENSGLVMNSNISHGGYISRLFDSTEAETEWGRIVISGNFSQETEYLVYALAQNHDLVCHNDENQPISNFLINEKISFAEKLNVLKASGAQVSSNAADILLFSQRGRYFIFGIQIFSHQPVTLKEVSLIYPKETLMQYLPEVYSAEGGDFLERYMSIFGSLFYDKREIMAKLPDYLNLDKAPDDVLPILAEWLGINCDVGFLDSCKIRRLLRLAKNINEYKGTKQVLEDVIEVYLGERPIVMEQFKWQKYEGITQQKECQNLYGNRNSEFTILLKNKVDEQTFLHFKNLIESLIPIRTNARIVFLDRDGQFDRYSYMDENARLIEKPAGVLNNQDQTFDSDFALA